MEDTTHTRERLQSCCVHAGTVLRSSKRDARKFRYLRKVLVAVYV